MESGGLAGVAVDGKNLRATGDRRYSAGMELAEVTCPTCFEVFEVAVPHSDEMPTEVDYDCEVCCRPMMIVFTEDEVYAKGLGD
jgi:hypothetical protein